jgi:hypothetical protein
MCKSRLYSNTDSDCFLPIGTSTGSIGKTAANWEISTKASVNVLNWKKRNINQGQNLSLNKIVLMQGMFTVVKNQESS